MESGIFNMDINSLISTETKDSDIYKPSLGKEKLDKYVATIKFLPWIKDYRLSRIKKWQTFLKNLNTNSIKAIDCPSTVKEPSLLRDIYYQLTDKSGRADFKKIGEECFGRKKVVYSLVQIIKDKQHPELEGKIKIFQYGTIIDKMIEQILSPDKDAIEAGVVKNNIFDIFEGRSFQLTITQGPKWPEYGASTFLPKVHPFLLDGEPITEPTPKILPKIEKFLRENSPDLESLAYKPWDADTKKYIYEAIEAAIPDDSDLYADIFKNNKAFFSSIDVSEMSDEPKVKAQKPIKATISEMEDDADEADEYLKTKSASKPKAKIVIDEDDDDIDIDIEADDDDDDTDIIINKMQSNTSKKSSKVDIDEDDDDEVFTKKTKPTAKPKRVVVEDDDDDEDFLK